MDFIAAGHPARVSEQTDRPTRSNVGDLAARLEGWRRHLDQYEHPVVLFDSSSWPVLLNRSFQTLILNDRTLPGTDQTVSSVWKAACTAAADLVAKRIRSESQGDIAEVFAIRQKCFAALGSLIQWPQGGGTGAVINLAEIGSPELIVRSVLSGRLAGDMTGSDEYDGSAATTEYQQWLAHRELAREKIAALTKRETEVLAHLAHGHPNKRIATCLGVSVKTIEKHRASASTKLGVRSSAEMVRISVVAGQELHADLASQN